MPRPKPVFRLHPGSGRWILDALVVNNLLRRKTKIPRISKRISLPRILLLMHHQARPNILRHSPRRNRIVVFTKENLNDRAMARILLPLASTPLLSGKTRTKIRTRKTYLILNATPLSKKIIMPTNVPRKSQKTSVSLDNFYVGDWG